MNNIHYMTVSSTQMFSEFGAITGQENATNSRLHHFLAKAYNYMVNLLNFV
jgi:hypothetical protein